MTELQLGDTIPQLTLLNQNGESISLPEIAAASKYVVIFAYPKALTPGCTRQVCGFQSNLSQLKQLDASVFGLSADSPKAQHNFVEKQGLEYDLLCDPEYELIGPLGGKKSPSGIKRSHWIFENGVLKVKKIQISPEDSFGSAIEDIKGLSS